MTMTTDIPRRQASLWKRGLIAAAVCSLAISLATRYCFVSTGNQSETTIKSEAPSKRQHLVNGGLQWTTPTVKFGFFEPGHAHSLVIPEVPPVTNLYPDNCLHNRPPPSC